ncbi:MAG: GNAT family N-acetyltransferase [Sphingomonadaceae bacterium]|nr:GNAT family N-acetyltransferase [Sphingomonadaceae bacterium]
MDRQPVLTGERLILRPLVEADRAALYAVASDPLLWEQHPMHNRWQRPVFDAMFDEALAAGGALAATLRDGGAVVGSSQFRPTRFDPDAMEIGWTYLARVHWGTGLNHEMKRLMLAHALAHVPRVLFRIGEHNIRSRKAIEAVGGVLTDMVDERHDNGQPLRHVVYQIDRAGFASGPLSASRP